MSVKRLMALGIAFSAAVAVLPVHAGGASAGFKALDTDADGVINMQEAEANKGISANYNKLDSNKDGNLDASEFSAFESSTATPSADPKTMVK